MKTKVQMFRLSFFSILLIVFVYIVLSVLPVRAATTLTVNSTADAVDATPGDGICATAGAVCTLRAAVQEANALAGTDTILIPAGTYTLSISGDFEDSAATGDIDITSDINISKTGVGTVTISGSSIDDRIFEIPSGAPTVNIFGVTLTNTAYTGDGKCLKNSGGTLGIDTVIFNLCATPIGGGAGGGGGIWNVSGDMSVSNSTFSNNQHNGGGGGILFQGPGTAIISNSIFDSNIGGGFFMYNGGTANISDTVFTNNSIVGSGGAIYSTGTALNISGSTFDSNTATTFGGAIYVGGGTSFSLTDSTVKSNTSGGHAGGIYTTIPTTIIRSTISGNSALTGQAGGIWTTDAISITNSTISGNSTVASGTVGGGAFFAHSTQTQTLLNNTFANNLSSGGGGAGFFLQYGTLSIKNTILSNPDDGLNCAAYGGTTITSTGYNISSDDSCSAFMTTSGDQNNTDPLLGALANNGGPTFTHAITSASPAFNNGNNSGAPATDQRGTTRPQGSTVDIGALELVVAPISGDTDGVSDSTENAAPNSGDANNDGVPDKNQATVTSFLNSITNKYAVLDTTGCSGNSNVTISPSDSMYLDAGYSYPAGLMNFTLTCSPGATATVNMYYYGLSPTNLVLRKYNANTHTYTSVTGATVTSVTIGGQQATKITYQIADGGPLDTDGVVNGTIVDPAGPALPVSAPNTGLQHQSSVVFYLTAILGFGLISHELYKIYTKKTRATTDSK